MTGHVTSRKRSRDEVARAARDVTLGGRGRRLDAPFPVALQTFCYQLCGKVRHDSFEDARRDISSDNLQ